MALDKEDVVTDILFVRLTILSPDKASEYSQAEGRPEWRAAGR